MPFVAQLDQDAGEEGCRTLRLSNGHAVPSRRVCLTPKQTVVDLDRS